MTDLPDPLVGRIVHETWEIKEFVARGSMGAVYRGANVKTTTPVAIKVLNPEFLSDDEIRERFRREATVSGRCDSAHLVQVLDLCTEPDGYVFLIMEWLAGQSLSDLLKQRGHLELDEVVAILTQVGAGLRAAHSAGIIHRDLKPQNIYLQELEPGGPVTPKILDFGISKIIEAGAELTATATMMGTPHYMPMEQFDSSRDVDERADIYALGVITYELLAGKRPFGGSSAMQILHAISHQDPPPLPTHVPDDVATVIAKAMARHAEDRYSGVEEFIAALTEAAGLPSADATGPGTVASGIALRPPAAAEPPTRPPPDRGPAWRLTALISGGPAWRLPVFIGAGVLAVAAIVLVVWLLARGGSTPAEKSKKGSPPPAGQKYALWRKLDPTNAHVLTLAVDSAGRHLAASERGRIVRIWELGDGRLVRKIEAPSAALALLPDGRELIAGEPDGGIARYEVSSGKRLGGFPSRFSGVRALACSGDGNRLVVVGRTGRAAVFDLRTGRRVARLGRATAARLSGDGHQVLIGDSKGRIVLRDVLRPGPLHTFAAGSQPVRDLALNPEVTLGLAGSQDGTVRLLDLTRGGVRRELRGPGKPITAVALTEDGTRAVTATRDGLVTVVHLASGKIVASLRGGGPVAALSVARNGSLIALAGPAWGVWVYRRAQAAK